MFTASFIKAMEIRGGYHEEKWDEPSEDGYQDSLYVFPYDWRLDNVENARLLIRKIETLKIKLKKPELEVRHRSPFDGRDHCTVCRDVRRR